MAVLHDILHEASQEASLAVNTITRQMDDETTYVMHGQTYTAPELVPIFTNTRNVLNNVIFAIRDRYTRTPFQLHNNLSLLLSLFERNQLLGWDSMPINDYLSKIQQYLATLRPSRGTYVALLAQMIRGLDMMYQIRMTVSLYYHNLE